MRIKRILSAFMCAVMLAGIAEAAPLAAGASESKSSASAAAGK